MVGLYVPAGHAVNVWRTLAAPVLAQKPPTGHRSHDVARRSSLSLPAGQLMQPTSERVSLGLKVPGVHLRGQSGAEV